jgi:hypothetical protein
MHGCCQLTLWCKEHVEGHATCLGWELPSEAAAAVACMQGSCKEAQCRGGLSHIYTPMPTTRNMQLVNLADSIVSCTPLSLQFAPKACLWSGWVRSPAKQHSTTASDLPFHPRTQHTFMLYAFLLLTHRHIVATMSCTLQECALTHNLPGGCCTQASV